MIVSGRVSNKMAPVLREIYDQMPEPKWVIAMGVCASRGGHFNNYAIVQGVDKLVPSMSTSPVARRGRRHYLTALSSCKSASTRPCGARMSDLWIKRSAR